MKLYLLFSLNMPISISSKNMALRCKISGEWHRKIVALQNWIRYLVCSSIIFPLNTCPHTVIWSSTPLPCGPWSFPIQINSPKRHSPYLSCHIIGPLVSPWSMRRIFWQQPILSHTGVGRCHSTYCEPLTSWNTRHSIKRVDISVTGEIHVCRTYELQDLKRNKWRQ